VCVCVRDREVISLFDPIDKIHKGCAAGIQDLEDRPAWNFSGEIQTSAEHTEYSQPRFDSYV